jgi:hypothetical protein
MDTDSPSFPDKGSVSESLGIREKHLFLTPQKAHRFAGFALLEEVFSSILPDFGFLPDFYHTLT